MDLPQLLATMQEVCGNLVSKYGLWGVAASMLFESAGIPFLSSIVLLTAGGMILSGRAGFWLLLLASTAGIISGSMISYIIGYLGGSVGRVVGDYFNRNSDKNAAVRITPFSKVYPFMEKYGTYSIFVGQLWGVTRTFISFPAGALKMNLLSFVLYTALGGAAFSLWIIGWSLIITSAAGLFLKLLRFLHLLAPRVWPLLILVAIIIAVMLYRRRR